MFTYPMLVLTDIIICIYMKIPSLTCCIFYAIIMLLAHVISIIIGMVLDSSAPYVEWDDEYSALRGKFFNMAIMMVLTLVVGLLGVLLYEVLKLPITAYFTYLYF